MSIIRTVLFRSHINYSTNSRDSLLLLLSRQRNKLFNVTRRKFNSSAKEAVKNDSSKFKLLPSILKFGFGSLGGITTTCLIKSRVSTVLSKEYKVPRHIEEADKKLKFDWEKFLQYLYPYIWHILIALSSAFAVAMLSSWIPYSMQQLINVIMECYQHRGDAEAIKDLLLRSTESAFQLACMYVMQAAFTFLYIYTLAQAGERVAIDMKQDLFKSIMMQDIKFFDENRSGEILSRLTHDIDVLKSSFKTCVWQGVRNVTQIIGCMVCMTNISPRMSAATVLLLPIVILIGTLFGRILRKLSNEAHVQYAKAVVVCEEAIQNIRTVKAFAAEDKEVEMYSKELKVGSALSETLGFGIGLFQGGMIIFLNSTVLSTLYFGGRLLSTEQFTPGRLMAFLMAAQTMQKSLTQLSLVLESYVKGITSGARVFEYLNMPPSPMMTSGEIITDQSLVGNITFKDVKFSYPTRENHVILKDFNLHIPAGKTVAIVGTSGNGKSTIAALLERFYDVNDGSITIDGKDLRTLNASYLRGNVLGYIDQQPILFATSIIENIRYGKPDATDEEVIEMAKKANAHDFIMQFPLKYETQVGERGAQLSGGQKQRIAIARALLKKPSILILDEATSALDYESEKIVQKALDNVIQGRTVLVIAHRLSTIKNADMIVVLKRGMIAEMGTHQELIKKKGLYYTLINEQDTQDT